MTAPDPDSGYHHNTPQPDSGDQDSNEHDSDDSGEHVNSADDDSGEHVNRVGDGSGDDCSDDYDGEPVSSDDHDGEPVSSDDHDGEPVSSDDDCSERDTGERDTSERDTSEPVATERAATAPVGNPDGSDSVVNGATGDTADSPDSGDSVSERPVPRSAASNDAGTGQAGGTGLGGAADQTGAIATFAANRHGTPNPISRSADGATPAAAQHLPCPTCGGHQPETPSTGTTGNRDERRAARRATRQGRRPHLTVTLSASTLAGLDRLPGHLEGYGAITAATALMIAESAASITSVLLDPASGSITGTGTRTYRPSQTIRDIATTLATTCRFPSCRQPAWRCDLDHRDPFDHHHPDTGGPTDPSNIDPLCRGHHWLKHHSAWSSTRGPGHTQNWTSPTGHRYTDPPRALTLPGELLDPTAPDTSAASNADATAEAYRAPDAYPATDCRHPNPEHSPSNPDGEGLRPDWRDAEFGGPFPDTLELKVLVTTVRNRVQRVRDIITAPRRTRTAENNNDHGKPSDSDTAGQDDTDPPTEGRRVDPDEPPF